MELLQTSVPEPNSPSKLGMVRSPRSSAQSSQTLSDQLYPHYVANVPAQEWQAAPPSQWVTPGLPTDPSTPRPPAEGRLNFTRFKQEADHRQRDKVNDSQQQQIEANVTESPWLPTMLNTTMEQHVNTEDHHKRLQEEMHMIRQQDQPSLDQIRAEEALYLDRQRANELQHQMVDQARALEQKRCAEEKVWREEQQRKLEEVRYERAAAVSNKVNMQASAPVIADDDVMRGRDAVLQAVLADLHRTRDKLQKSEAEVVALRAELGGSGDAVGRAHAKVMDLEALRSELREARSAAQHQGDLVQMRDVEIASLRKELREVRTVQLQLQCSPSRNIEAEERCKLLEVQVDRLQAELSLKDSKLQEASCSQQAEERCKTLQSQIQMLQADLSAKSAKLDEALHSRAVKDSVATHDAEERCKVLEARVQELQANLAKRTAVCTELESSTERPRRRRVIGEDSGSHGTEQTPKAVEAAVDMAVSSGSCLANVLQPLSSPSSGNRSARFRQEVRQAATSVNGVPVDRYEELQQLRQDVQQAPTSANAASVDRHGELQKLQQDVQQASTSANAASVDRYEELQQLRQDVRQASTSATTAPADRYEELVKLRKLLINGDADV